MLLQNYEERKMGYGDGSGNTLYKNFTYFNFYGTADRAKVSLSSSTLMLPCLLSGATYNSCFSYVGVPWEDLYFASDDKGLWVPYATKVAAGYLV